MPNMPSRKEIIAAQERLRRKHFPADEDFTPKPPQHRRREKPKLGEFTKNLNASQRSCLTKFTRTGEVDSRNKVTEQRPSRVAKAKSRKQQQQQEAA
jgi:hypothetical protein